MKQVISRFLILSSAATIFVAGNLVMAGGLDIKDIYGEDGTIQTNKIEDVISDEVNNGEGINDGIDLFI